LHSRIKVKFGVFEDLLKPLQHKVGTMTPGDEFCTFSMDEMEIDQRLHFNQHEHQFYEHVILGNTKEFGNELLVFLVHGIKNLWKQIVGAHIVGRSTTHKMVADFINEYITYLEKSGLYVVSAINHMGPNNQGVWTHMGLKIDEDGRRNDKIGPGKKICIPDVCLLVEKFEARCNER